MSRLKVNFTSNEASSEARSVEVIPTGEYQCSIVDVETTTVNPGSANSGKPYWKIRFVVQEGKYAGNSIFGRIMLFEGKDGTLSSLAQFLRALGHQVNEGTFELPEDDEISGSRLTIVGRKFPAGTDKKTGKEVSEQFKVTGYKAPYQLSEAQKTGDASLLP